MLEIKSITKSFREDFWKPEVKILDQLSFSLPESEITGFVGENGAGKTTTISIILDILKPEFGNIIYSEKLGKQRREIFDNLGYMPEQPRFFENLTGKELLEYFGAFHKMEKKTIYDRVNSLGDKLEMNRALRVRIGNYSKGMKQRIGLMAAVLHRPKLLILDEPLSGLDPNGRAVFKEIIKGLGDEGATVFLTSHILEDLEELSDNCVYIKNGKSEKGVVKKSDLIGAMLEIKLKNISKYPRLLEKIENNSTTENYGVISCLESEREVLIKENSIDPCDIMLIRKQPLNYKRLSV